MIDFKLSATLNALCDGDEVTYFIAPCSTEDEWVKAHNDSQQEMLDFLGGEALEFLPQHRAVLHIHWTDHQALTTRVMKRCLDLHDFLTFHTGYHTRIWDKTQRWKFMFKESWNAIKATDTGADWKAISSVWASNTFDGVRIKSDLPKRIIFRDVKLATERYFLGCTLNPELKQTNLKALTG